MAADDHLGIETQAYRHRVAGARGVGGPQRKAVHIGAVERRHVDRRRHVMGEHAGERRREHDRLGRQRRELDMARETRGGLLGRDYLEELLLPGGTADGGEQMRACPHPNLSPLAGEAEEGGLSGDRSWPGSYHDRGSGRMTFTIGRHQDPAISLGDRLQRQVA